jgi:hypothetical protein
MNLKQGREHCLKINNNWKKLVLIKRLAAAENRINYMNQLFEDKREDLLRKAECKNINKMRSIDFWPGGIEFDMSTGERSGEICSSEGPELANFTGLRVRFEENTDLKEVVAGLKAICEMIKREIDEKEKLEKEPTGVCNNCGKVVKRFKLIKIAFVGHAYSQIPNFPEYIDICEECSNKTGVLNNPDHDGLSDLRTFSGAREEAKNWHESVKSFIDKAEAEWKSYEESEEPEKEKSKNNADFEMC